MDSYGTLKQLAAPIFQRTGHKQTAEEIRPDVFGSAYSVFDNGHSKIRLVWDGRDAWAVAQLLAPNSSNDWHDISTPLRREHLENGSDSADVSEFLAAIERVAT
jgi:hypothetical protein